MVSPGRSTLVSQGNVAKEIMKILFIHSQSTLIQRPLHISLVIYDFHRELLEICGHRPWSR
jgi:5-carboxymethyl-2-hydroxymuconate isomerase